MQVIAIKDAAHWHHVRSQNVGGSEIAALFGLSPYATRYSLWHIKAGHVAPDDLSDNTRVQAGNYMEPAIAAWASDEYQTPLRKFAGYAVHPTIKGMGCTPDYINSDASLLVQIKNVDSLEFYKNKDWEAEGEILTKCPMHIALQVQHELACTGAVAAWLVVCVGGNRLLRMEIQPRPKTIAKLEAEVKAFWDSVTLGNEPKPDYTADGDTIAALMPEPVAGKAIDLSLNNRAHECAAEYLRGKEMEKTGDAIAEAAKAELLEMLGDAEIAMIGDFKVSAKMTKANPGKPITAAMIGEIVGARKSFRKFTVTQTGAAQ